MLRGFQRVLRFLFRDPTRRGGRSHACILWGNTVRWRLSRHGCAHGFSELDSCAWQDSTVEQIWCGPHRSPSVDRSSAEVLPPQEQGVMVLGTPMGHLEFVWSRLGSDFEELSRPHESCKIPLCCSRVGSHWIRCTFLDSVGWRSASCDF